MYIQLVVHRFPPDSWGGTELYTLHLAQALQKQGVDVQVLTYASGANAEPIAKDEIFQGIPVRKLAFSLDATDNPVRDEYDNRRVAAWLRGAWQANRPDLVHVTHLGYLSSSVLAVAHELSIPAVTTITDLGIVCVNGLMVRGGDREDGGLLCPGGLGPEHCLRCYAHMGPRGKSLAPIVDAVPTLVWQMCLDACAWPLVSRLRPMQWLFAMRQRERVIRERMLSSGTLFCLSDFAREMLVRRGYPLERLTLAPHGIMDPERLRRSTPIAEGEQLRLGYIGPLAVHKGAHLPLEAFRLLNDPSRFNLTYWGSLPDEPSSDYERTLRASLDQTEGVGHRGPFANNEVKHVLEQIDLLIMPSLCYENTPTIVYEALASGTPVIASDAGGMAEMIHAYRGGWLFARGDAAALAAIIHRLAEDRAELKRMAAGILRVPSFANHVQQVRQAYDRLRHARPGAAI